MRQRDVKQRLEAGDPWYTESQCEAALLPHQMKTVSGRHEFWRLQLRRFEDSERAREGRRRIADFGCGDGVNLGVLEEIKDAGVIGLDYNPVRIERVRSHAQRAAIMQASVLQLPLRNECLDLVLFNQVIEHIPDDVPVLREIWRILRPGGWLLLGTPNEGCWLAWLRNHVLERSILRLTDHVHFYTERELVRRIESAGFRVEVRWREGFMAPHQLLSSYLLSRSWGHRLIARLIRMFPSQCGGFQLVCRK